MERDELDIRAGFPTEAPFGANLDGDGVHFSLFSRNARTVWLLLYDTPQDDAPSYEISLDPQAHRTGDIWHVWIRDLHPGQLYLWRLDGPNDPGAGHRFDPNNLILDPYAKALTGDFTWEEADASCDEQNVCSPAFKQGASGIPKCIVCSDRFDWDGDEPLNRPLSETVIYECHVRGLTAHPSACVEHPGTFAGVIEKIPYFQSLGVTALELLPVHEFSVINGNRKNPLTGERLTNFWGYNTVSFFAPNGRFSSRGTLGQQVDDFKTMVKMLHRHGIEVILDVVFNHTAEGNEKGPILCFKGIDNSIYYLLDKRDGTYLDYTGCGNTFNCNHPVVRSFIISCLHYWVQHMHVDGFRFDLASVLGRDENGELMPNAPLLRSIEEDPVLRGAKIIAEAWDAAGAYQVGAFTGRWAEWNGRFRDDVRRFWRGDHGAVGAFATRLAGSSDLYGDDGRTPHHSINFVTSHDGFTLNDWASYQKKHNEGNGHDSTDGDDHNLSLNHGAEGPTENVRILAMRTRQTKNLFATLMLALGVPMTLGGDEFRRTQQGNNNAYCQDNEISWFDWGQTKVEKNMLRFVRELIAFRLCHRSLRRRSFYTGCSTRYRKEADMVWLGSHGREPDWNGADLALGALINGHFEHRHLHHDHDILILANANRDPAWFQIPDAPNGGPWRVAIDTANPPPEDIRTPGTEPLLGSLRRYPLKDRSLVVLIASCQETDEVDRFG